MFDPISFCLLDTSSYKQTLELTVDCVHETISSLSVAGGRKRETMTWFLGPVTKATVECMAGT